MVLVADLGLKGSDKADGQEVAEKPPHGYNLAVESGFGYTQGFFGNRKYPTGSSAVTA